MSARYLAAGIAIAAVLGVVRTSSAQTAPKEPPPRWDTQVGGAFVGTSGNTETSTIGADFSLHRRWPVWQIESNATAIRATNASVRTAERYLGAFRGQRKLSAILGLSAGERAERDHLSGIDFRSILDGGLTWALVRLPEWTLDGTTAVAWSHEQPVVGATLDHPIGLLQAMSRIPFGAAAETTQRFTYYPDFKVSSAYRSELELAAQAAMNSHLALKLGYLWRFSNAPVAGFKKTDNTTTASVVLRWRATTPAP
jgi:putative salt-induced outer membrane protein YdiY